MERKPKSDALEAISQKGRLAIVLCQNIDCHYVAEVLALDE